MNLQKSFENHLHGWFPQEPTSPARSMASVQNKETPQQQTYRWSRAVFAALMGLSWIFLGIMNILTKQYVVAVVSLTGAAVLLILAYGIKKYNLQVRPRFALAALFIILGAIFLFFNEVTLALFAFPALFAAPLLGTSWGVAILMGIVTILLTCLTIVVWLLQKNRLLRLLPDNYASKRQLLRPFAASAILLFSTYLAIISGLEFEYAIPLTFLIVGILILRGLRRFALTTPALVALLACMLLFSTAVAGAYTVTNVPENHYLATAQAPNANIVNLTVSTLQGDIRVYFTNDSSQIC